MHLLYEVEGGCPEGGRDGRKRRREDDDYEL